MKVVLTRPVTLGIKTLGDDDRRRVMAWFDHLANYENDPFVREHSKALPGGDNVLVLHTTTDVRIFYVIHDQEIWVLDVARKDSIDRLSTPPAKENA